MDANMMDMLLNGAGGAILGPLVSQVLGGKNQTMLVRIISGLIGGVGAGYGANAAGINLGDGQMMQAIQSLLEGGVGGGVLATIAGMMGKKK